MKGKAWMNIRQIAWRMLETQKQLNMIDDGPTGCQRALVLGQLTMTVAKEYINMIGTRNDICTM